LNPLTPAPLWRSPSFSLLGCLLPRPKRATLSAIAKEPALAP